MAQGFSDDLGISQLANTCPSEDQRAIISITDTVTLTTHTFTFNPTESYATLIHGS